MKTFMQDMSGSLDVVERGWVRMPATIFLGVAVLVICVLMGAYSGASEAWRKFIAPCWKGPNAKDSGGPGDGADPE